MSSEIISREVNRMAILDVKLDNFYAFKDFHMSLTYPKKIVGSSVENEHLKDFPNFRYKKVNIIMGQNASGKTTFGLILRNIFNFIDKKNLNFITDYICDKNRAASFSIDMVCKNNILYRIICKILPATAEKYTAENVDLEVRSLPIRPRDSYESCIKRLESAKYVKKDNFIDELDNIERLSWFFEYPKDTKRILHLPTDNPKFEGVLSHILMALDPAIQKVTPSQDVKNAYVIHLQNGHAVIIQDGEAFSTDLLSSGTKAGVEVAVILAALIEGRSSFYYCDEKFPYIHSDIEKAVLSLMIDAIHPNDQLFFTTHNTDILELDLPKHAFTFLRKDLNDDCRPITCVDASSFLKRNTDSLKRAVENDLFSIAPATDLIFEIEDL